MSIDHINLARLDLNLLVAFDALLAERSVTRAAAKIGIGQSAMSHALGRLRTTFADEILTRAPDGMRPTPRALALMEPVRAALSQIQAIVEPPKAFDPATAQVTFSLGIPDSTEVLLMPRLVAHLQRVAPGVRLLLHTTDRIRILDDLDSGRIDLGIGVFEQGQTHHKRRLLNKETYLCVFNAELVGVTPPISLDDYVRLPHVLTSLVETAHGVVDDALAKIGRSRVIAMTSPRFTVMPFVVQQAPVIATMHATLARFFSDSMGLTVSPPPIALPDVAISMLWHASNDAVPGQRWLRETIVGLRRDKIRQDQTTVA
ncbi:LysR family transcriptional regulator [Methylobacterium haplocladii]|uniref:LysR family transcriptional regulator n=1 Tax=Methylobacterium haplocladii TaxID=1176176 RepID=A0A512IQ55_9HYPH|nr:LysR family transcriptional regulator [Methylobacterium haplocladii]GEO99846.1 LysR family transcriptional regulator [Methylobacterium haplocladii]GJD84821.1 PCP degradation transcriptional activation protein [Methylobacterium haplocladii]GLS58010.1 LysR family transcriptional regulator [Methylobacterium haplocladii]